MTESQPGPQSPDEMRRLLAAVQEWAQRTLPAPPSGHAGPECQWCPLCQFASILRGEGPVLADRLGDAGGTLVTALRALLENAGVDTSKPADDPPASRVQHIRLDPEENDPAPATPPPPPPSPPARPSPAPRVQRIVLDPEPDPEPGDDA